MSRETVTGRLLIGVAAMALMAGCSAGARTTPGASASAEPQHLPLADELQRILDDGVQASNGLGVRAAVISAGHEPWTGAAGHSIRSSDALVSMRPEMLFEIGSVDKNLVTVIVLQLVAEGRISLEDPVVRWFPGYPQIPPAATVRDLIASTSGIAEWVDHPNSFFQPPLDPQKLARSWTVDEMLKELVGPPEFVPGQKWRYSTTGFRLIREIIERETGQPIADLIQARLLDPLGIHDMWLEPSWPIPSRYPVAHEWFDVDGDGNLDDITAIPKEALNDLVAAPVDTNAIDLARYCQGLFHDRALLKDAAAPSALARSSSVGGCVRSAKMLSAIRASGRVLRTGRPPPTRATPQPEAAWPRASDPGAAYGTSGLIQNALISSLMIV